MKDKKILIIFLITAFTTPLFAGAEFFGGIQELIIATRGVVNTLIPVIFALALLLFFWGVAKFILQSGDPEARKEGKQIMIWGIVALFVMTSIWGIVAFIGEELQIDTGGGFGCQDSEDGFGNPC